MEEGITSFLDMNKKDVPFRRVKVHPVKSPSNIEEQPVGLERTREGAQNRLDHCHKYVEDTSSLNGVVRWVCAIENGIFQVGGPAWMDAASILFVDLTSSTQSDALSAAIEIPRQVVDMTMELGMFFLFCIVS